MSADRKQVFVTKTNSKKSRNVSRRKFDAALKTRVAIDAIKGQDTLAELATRYGIHANQISKWKKQAIEGLPEIFGGSRGGPASTDEQLVAKLYEEIGRLKVELDWLKKKSDYFCA